MMSKTYINGYMHPEIISGYHVFKDGEYYDSEADYIAVTSHGLDGSDQVRPDYHTVPDVLLRPIEQRQDITDTAICITRELYEMEADSTVRQSLLDGCEGYCAEREAIAELATVFDTAYDKLPEDVCNGLNPWDMDMVPYLLNCAATWDDVNTDNVIQALADWVALDQIETAKRKAREL